jgi:hypothetical protein
MNPPLQKQKLRQNETTLQSLTLIIHSRTTSILIPKDMH